MPESAATVDPPPMGAAAAGRGRLHLRQIARRMSVAEGTVRKHLENIFERLQVTSRTAAVGSVFGHVASSTSGPFPMLRTLRASIGLARAPELVGEDWVE